MSTGDPPTGTAVFLGDRSLEHRERQGYASAFRRLGWDVRWWPSEDADLQRYVRSRERAIVVHADHVAAPVPIDLTLVPAPTVAFQFDTFTYPDVRIRRSMLFDVVCCPHPGWPELYWASGHPGAMLAPHAIDDEVYRKLQTDPSLDVGWVGGLEGRIYEGRRRLLPILAERFAMNDWRRPVSPGEVGPLFARSKIVVNIPRDDWRRDANLRVFEAMGAGALLISPMPSELTEIGLVEGVDFVGYRAEADVPAIVERYLQDEPARSRIAQSGRSRTLSDHSYVRRVEAILERALAPNPHRAPARRWAQDAVAQVIIEQYLQERRWKSLAGPARGLFRRAGWRVGAAGWYLVSRQIARVTRIATGAHV